MTKKYSESDLIRASARGGRDGERRGLIAGITVGVLGTLFVIGVIMVALTGGIR